MKASLLVLAVAMPLASHDIITTRLTYTREISRIFEHRCLACHGEQSSVPLTSYEQVRPWAVGIKEQVLSRAMPPWGAVKGFGDFKPDGGLSQEEILIVAAWVLGGAPQGDAALLARTGASEQGDRATPSRQNSKAESQFARLPISTPAVLRSSVKVVGLQPLESSLVESARITATLPDGQKRPLLWLFHYDGRNNRSFHLRHALELPAGTVVESTAAVHLALEVAKPLSPAQ